VKPAYAGAPKEQSLERGDGSTPPHMSAQRLFERHDEGRAEIALDVGTACVGEQTATSGVSNEGSDYSWAVTGSGTSSKPVAMERASVLLLG
jgi:hypothetical protein